MTNDHGLRVDCAAEFAKLHGEIDRLSNGKVTQAKALDNVAKTLAAVEAAHRGDHDEVMRALQGYQATLTGLFAAHAERLAIVEHRLNGVGKLLYGLAGGLTLLLIGLIVERFLGV